MLKLIFMPAFVYLPHPAWIVGALCVPQTSTPFNREGKTWHHAPCVVCIFEILQAYWLKVIGKTHNSLSFLYFCNRMNVFVYDEAN